uniref:NADPH-dependent FMN reductase n=1 Tax=Flavobacterium sp. TaxID=239 RepID=UPI00404ABC68
MRKIIAFGASSSKTSINKQFAVFAANQFQNAEVEVLDLNDFEMPIYSVDKEKENGIHTLAIDFYTKIGTADLIIISFAEHNGTYTAAFKNILDWSSRINAKTFQEKPMFLLATSPGPRGGSSVLEMAKSRFPFQGGNIEGSFSLPNFYDNFDDVNGIINEELKSRFIDIIKSI